MSRPEVVELTLGRLDQIPVGEGREFLVGDRRVAVFRPRGGPVAVTDAECPHRRGPLADGTVGMGSIVCPLHGMRFCLRTGAAITGDCGGIAVHAARVTGSGQVVVALPARALAHAGGQGSE